MSQGPFYTDMGAGLLLRNSEGETTLPRFGVWKWDFAKQRHQVADVGDNLDELRAKHGAGPLVDVPSGKP